MAKYSDVDRATALAALDANGGDVCRTARQLGIPRQTLQTWAFGRGGTADLPTLREEKRLDLAAQLEELAYKLVAAIPDKVNDATLQQVAVSLGIAIDKMRLLREQPTTIQRDDSLTDSERATRLAGLLALGRDRARGSVPGPDPGGAGGGGPAPPVH